MCTKRAPKRVRYLQQEAVAVSGWCIFSTADSERVQKKTALVKEFNQPVLLKLLWQFQMLDWQEKNGQLTFKIATKPSVTSGTTRIDPSLGWRFILSTEESLVSSAKNT